MIQNICFCCIFHFVKETRSVFSRSISRGEVPREHSTLKSRCFLWIGLHTCKYKFFNNYVVISRSIFYSSIWSTEQRVQLWKQLSYLGPIAAAAAAAETSDPVLWYTYLALCHTLCRAGMYLIFKQIPCSID